MLLSHEVIFGMNGACCLVDRLLKKKFKKKRG